MLQRYTQIYTAYTVHCLHLVVSCVLPATCLHSRLPDCSETLTMCRHRNNAVVVTMVTNVHAGRAGHRDVGSYCVDQGPGLLGGGESQNERAV